MPNRKMLGQDAHTLWNLIRLQGFSRMSSGNKAIALAGSLLITSPVWLGALFASGAWRWFV